MNEYINYEISGSIAIMEFFHPSHNSMNMDLLETMSLAFSEIDKIPQVKCILLKSHGERSFCAGANFEELKSIKTPEQGLKFFSGFGNVINSMRTCSKIVIGRIQGKAVGGGVGLMAACDIAFGTKYSSIRLSELSIGIGPFVIAPAVIRKTGLSAFSELSLKPTVWKDASWAKANGLVSEVFDDILQMDEYIDNYLKEISGYSIDALSENKKLLWQGTENWPQIMSERAAISGRLALNADL
ncbi:MAG: enoyl-CoA hydratase/isomerase family protein [Saprospiraceae bacterium]|nr:enoyl-CoA hydratase/isomerase family protein [Saprospiraceae bacterium]